MTGIQISITFGIVTLNTKYKKLGTYQITIICLVKNSPSEGSTLTQLEVRLDESGLYRVSTTNCLSLGLCYRIRYAETYIPARIIFNTLSTGVLNFKNNYRNNGYKLI